MSDVPAMNTDPNAPTAPQADPDAPQADVEAPDGGPRPLEDTYRNERCEPAPAPPEGA